MTVVVELQDNEVEGDDEGGITAVMYGTSVDGGDRTSRTPAPSCPNEFVPAQYTLPFPVSTHMKSNPPAMLSTVGLSGTTGPGEPRESVSPYPEAPHTLLPQQLILPEASTAQVSRALAYTPTAG